MSSPAFALANKSPDAFRTISEVAADLDVPQHVLRFWESRFSQIRPVKRAGGRRYYRPEDIDLLRGIRALLYVDGFTIRGVQKVLKDKGLRHVAGIGRGIPEAPAEPVVVEKHIFIEKPQGSAQGPAKKRPTHLRAVPSPRPMSLPFFFDDEDVGPKATAPMPVEAVVAPSIPVIARQPQSAAPAGLAQEERQRLQTLLVELEGLKTRLHNARQSA